MSVGLAIFFGGLFGFVLQKVGATNSNNIIGMLRLQHFHLMKAIFFAIGISSLGLFTLIGIGALDVGNLSVKSSYIGVIIGGTIFGIGWAMASFCPGTGIAALGTGSKKAIFYVLGGLVGAFIFMLIYGFLENTFLFKELGGKITIAQTSKYASLLEIPGIVLAGILGLAFVALAFLLPNKTRD